MNIEQERQLLQELLESGKLDSLSVQVIALNLFADSFGYKAVNGDTRKGFYRKYWCKVLGWEIYKGFWKTDFISLQAMINRHNYSPFVNILSDDHIITRIGLQYNKKLGKLTTQKYWIKFVKE